jgi:hypothetical protein
MAFAAVYDSKTGDLTPLGTPGHAVLGRWCSSNWNPDFWLNIVDLVEPVADYFADQLGGDDANWIPTEQQIEDFLEATRDLITTPFRNRAGSCETEEQAHTLASGSANYLLRPNAPIRVTLFSSYYVRTRGYGCYKAAASVASDYFLMGVVESQLTQDEECCADKFGNYIVGSLSTPPNGDVENDAPHSIENRLQDVGFALSAYGSWYDLPTGSSSGQILLEKVFNLIYGPSCDSDDDERPGDSEVVSTTSLEQNGTSDVRIYPSVASEQLNIEINTPDVTFSQIKLLDLQGRVLQIFFSGELEAEQHTMQFPLAGIAKGIYLVNCQIGSKSQSFKVIIL